MRSRGEEVLVRAVRYVLYKDSNTQLARLHIATDSSPCSNTRALNVCATMLRHSPWCPTRKGPASAPTTFSVPQRLGKTGPGCIAIDT